jgi:hypothetical protein
MATKRSLTNQKQLHERVPKLRVLHPKDQAKFPHHCTKRGHCTVQSGQTLTFADNNIPAVAYDLPRDDADNDEKGSSIIAPPT